MKERERTQVGHEGLSRHTNHSHIWLSDCSQSSQARKIRELIKMANWLLFTDDDNLSMHICQMGAIRATIVFSQNRTTATASAEHCHQCDAYPIDSNWTCKQID